MCKDRNRHLEVVTFEEIRTGKIMIILPSVSVGAVANPANFVHENAVVETMADDVLDLKGLDYCLNNAKYCS